MTDFTSLVFQPVIDRAWIYGFAIIAILLFGFIFMRSRQLPLFRAGFIFIVLLMLANPVLKSVSGTPTETLIHILVDKSDSEKLAGRIKMAEALQQHVVKAFSDLENVVPILTEIDNTENHSSTHMFDVLRDLVAAERPGRIGGSIFITDGQITDIPKDMNYLKKYGPIHVLMTGNREEEFDRHIKILSSPGYAVVGDDLPLRIRIEEDPVPRSKSQRLKIFVEDKKLSEVDVPVGQDYTLKIPMDRSGELTVRLAVKTDKDELSAVNNTAVLRVQGVRESLKVLLVSGQPHQGLRIWRNLLKSDPAVDLVHFTILRSYGSIDITPQEELALIPFPTEELFKERINDFDLIIMDRFTRRSILLPEYFKNMADYVREGGGFLVVHGPEESVESALANTFLGDILPYKRIRGAVVSKTISPQISDYGARHPITAALQNAEQDWGDWERFLKAEKQDIDSHILLETKDGQPLLIIDEVGDGRIAQFMTDQIWLWARGYDGGGPYGTIMKRLAHWLMKEPSLDYNPLKAEAGNQDINISFTGAAQENAELSIQQPDGTKQVLDVETETKENGLVHFETRYSAALPGLYSVSYGAFTETVLFGDLNAPEIQQLVSNPESMAPVADATGGIVLPPAVGKTAKIGLSGERKSYQGNDKILFRQSTELENRSVNLEPLVPWWAAAFFGIVMLLAGWLRQE